MHRHPRGTCISTRHAPADAKWGSRLIPSFLRGLGVIATFAVAMLALTAMISPALADWPSSPPAAECQPARD
jgi:hypothetical protein